MDGSEQVVRVRHKVTGELGTAKGRRWQGLIWVNIDNSPLRTGFFLEENLAYRVPARTAPLTPAQRARYGLPPYVPHLQQLGRGSRCVVPKVPLIVGEWSDHHFTLKGAKIYDPR
jgi:hypothetical protein